MHSTHINITHIYIIPNIKCKQIFDKKVVYLRFEIRVLQVFMDFNSCRFWVSDCNLFRDWASINEERDGPSVRSLTGEAKREKLG